MYRVRLVTLGLLVLLLVAGCANEIGEPSSPTTGTNTMPESPSSSAPGATSSGSSAELEDTDLTIVINDGSGSTKTWRLTCNPAGGTHPNPQAACQALEANGAAALPPVPKDKACTQIYGGPQTAPISGTWKGQPVMSTFARNDGCQISRWKLMAGLLPRGGN